MNSSSLKTSLQEDIPQSFSFDTTPSGDKTSFQESTLSFSWSWIFLIFILLITLATLWYFYPRIQQEINNKIQPIKENREIENALEKQDEKKEENEQNEKHNDNQVKSDDAYSSIQSHHSSSKAGWCFIGEDRGFRSCAHVSERDQCMSGQIFPTQDVCVNPSLRV